MGSCYSLQRALDREICPGRWVKMGERGRDIPGDAMYFGYFAWFEDCVGYAAKSSPDIEGDDEGARGPGIGLAHVRGGLGHGTR